MSKRERIKIKGNPNIEYTLSNVRTAANLRLPIQTVNYTNQERDYSFLKDLPTNNYKNV